MTSYYVPDITGSNPLYLQANIPGFIYEPGIKVYFQNSPIFESSLVIQMTDGTGRLLDKNVDWEVNPEDIDQAAMSRAFLQDNQFTGKLLKSITIISNKALNQSVALTYQEFYLTLPGVTFDDGTPLELTPDLIKNLITGLADVRQQVARVQSPVAPIEPSADLLPFDIDGIKSSNAIVGEVVTVNTVVGAKVIRLRHGAYFANSLVLKYNGSTLSANTDYLPINYSPLTKQSRNTGGIYNHIALIGSFAGDVTIDYHAVGGDVQPADVDNIQSLMLAIKTYLNDGIFVTSDTVTETPAFRSVAARLTLLEDDVRRILSGTPTYGDSSTGVAVTRPISAVDSDFHWWTIASLYQVQGSTDIIKADAFKGRVYFPGSKVSLSFTVDINIDQSRNSVSFKTDSLIFDPKYTQFGDLDVAATQYPMVRVVWNQAPESFSGAFIQVGIPLPTLADLMVVEDFSTPESCWLLTRTHEWTQGQTVVPSYPDDNGFLLPDGVSTWSASSSISHNKTYVPKYDDGYLVYAGSAVTVDDITTVSSTSSLFNVVLPDYVPISSAKVLVVTMLSADSTKIYNLEIPLNGLDNLTRTGRLTFSDSDLETMTMLAKLTQDNLGNIAVSLNITEVALPLVSATPSAKTDIVRYIRIRV